MQTPCAFCDNEIDGQEIIRTSLIKVIYPRRPVIEAAAMIMPIRHCEHIHALSTEEVADIFAMVGKIQAAFQKIYAVEGYNLFANDGIAAGQHIPHVHFHLYGRSKNEPVSPFAILNDTKSYQEVKRLSSEEIRERMERIRREFGGE